MPRDPPLTTFSCRSFPPQPFLSSLPFQDIDSFACNLDHNNSTVYLHGLPSSQGDLFSFAETVESQIQKAGIKVNTPRKTLFHMTLARVGYDFPVDRVVQEFLSDPTAWHFGKVVVSSFTIDGKRYHAAPIATLAD